MKPAAPPRVDSAMELHPGLVDIALRIAAALLAGGLLGYDRSQRGRAAGLRTTMLVTLAATVAMVMGNVLLPTGGKTAGAFAQIDVLRLPLGILSGIGFIGAGAIVRQGDLVRGVTTAATLWMATVIGLVLGAGLFPLAGVALAASLVVLWLLKLVEARMHHERRGVLTVTASQDGPSRQDLDRQIRAAGFSINGWATTAYDEGLRREIQCSVAWRDSDGEAEIPPFVETLAEARGALSVKWVPSGVDSAFH